MSTLEMREATTRVAEGIAFLDRKMPGWRSRVDAGRIVIGDTKGFCAASQASGGLPYGKACVALGIGTWTAVRLGFDITASDMLTYADLTHAWRRALAA